MAAALFVPSLVVSTTTGWPLVLTIIVLGSFVTLYTMLGGIEGIIWTDVIQFCLMLGGVAATLAITVYSVPGGVSGIWDYAVSQGKTNLIAPIPPEANTLWDQLRFIFTDYRSIVGIMTTLAFGYVLSLILPGLVSDQQRQLTWRNVMKRPPTDEPPPSSANQQQISRPL